MKIRIKHIEAHRIDGENRLTVRLDHILYNTGNQNACIGLLSDYSSCCAMSEWFTHQDIMAMRGWCYVTSRLDQELYQRVPDTMSPGAKMLQLLEPLLSNNKEMISWFANYDQAYDMQRVENPKTHDFWAYQGVIALRGDWVRLASRCLTILDNPPRDRGRQKYLIDYKFHLALARGDMMEMQETLRTLVSPRMIYRRDNDESGYTADLVSTPAVIYAKIARLHGYDFVIDTPYIPMEWLAMEPLPDYDAHFDFLK